MFNGIIFNKGFIKKISKRSKGINIFVKSELKLNSKDIGVSVACDGVCLTLIKIQNKIMEFYLYIFLFLQYSLFNSRLSLAEYFNHFLCSINVEPPEY